MQGNNLNFFTEAGIVSRGTGTTVTNNVGEKEEAYVGMSRSPAPDFTKERIERFFRE